MSFSVQKQGEVFVLAGVLDETADLSSLTAASGPWVIQFRGVTRINSCGVRDWVQAMAKAAPPSVVYQECSMPIVKQLNAVPAFMGIATVESILAPYFCGTCDKDTLCLLNAVQFQTGEVPVLPCPTCNGALSFDAIPAQYLGFAKRQKPQGS